MERSRPELRLVANQPGEPTASDDALMARAQGGDRGAFGRLVTAHEAGLRRLALWLVGDPERARELVQDALILAWERRAHYVPDGKLAAWLMAFVRNLSRRELRRRRVRALFGLGAMGSPPAWTAPAEDRDGFEARAASDRERVLAAAIGRLPPKMREAVVLRFVEDLDYDTMAMITGVSASTLRSRVHYGLAALAERVPEELLR